MKHIRELGQFKEQPESWIEYMFTDIGQIEFGFTGHALFALYLTEAVISAETAVEDLSPLL